MPTGRWHRNTSSDKYLCWQTSFKNKRFPKDNGTVTFRGVGMKSHSQDITNSTSKTVERFNNTFFLTGYKTIICTKNILHSFHPSIGTVFRDQRQLFLWK